LVVTSQNSKSSKGFVVAADAAQRVRHAASRISDHMGVAGASLALTGRQVGNAPHRQPRQVGDLDTDVAGDRDDRRADRGRLIEAG
jgi:hypothetical protein